MRFAVGQEHDGLEFIRVLQPSKNSVSYVVRDVISQRLEHLKLVPDHLQQDEETTKRFLREAKLHAALAHPNVAQFYSVRRIDGALVMTREWVEGETLASKITAGPIPAPQAIDYLGQALVALGHAHGQGVIHRDITPHSLLVTESGVVKLTGFNLARSMADPRLTSTGVVMGSVHYIAPEQVKGMSEAEERSDLYACGVVLFEAVTGHRPYERDSDFDVMLAHVDDPVPFPSELNESIAAELEDVIRKALAKDPAERFQTAGEFREALLAEADLEMRRSLKSSVVPESPPLTDVPQPEPTPHYTPAGEPFQMDPGAMTGAWTRDTADISRMLGIAIAGFSVGLLIFLGSMILINSL